jgi:hypothetical protein
MGQAIYYCCKCGKLLRESAFERATALWISSKATCLECAVQLMPVLTPREQTAVTLARSRVPSTRKPQN